MIGNSTSRNDSCEGKHEGLKKENLQKIFFLLVTVCYFHYVWERQRILEQHQSNYVINIYYVMADKVSNYIIDQGFPTTVPRNTSVPQAGPKCSVKFFETLKFIQKCRIFGFKCSVRGFLGLKCSARTLPGLKCSTSKKRLGTTGLHD